MALTQEAVDKLEMIHEKDTGEKLSDEDAWEMATRLLELGCIVAGEDPEGGLGVTFDKS